MTVELTSAPLQDMYCPTYVLLRKIDDILQVGVVSVSFNGFIDKRRKLLMKPVLVDEAQDASNELSKEDHTEADGKLKKHGQLQATTSKHIFYQRNVTVRNGPVPSRSTYLEKDNANARVFRRSGSKLIKSVGGRCESKRTTKCTIAMWRVLICTRFSGVNQLVHHGYQTKLAPWATWGLRGQPVGRIITLTQQRRHLNLLERAFASSFPAKGVMNSRQIISRRLSVRINHF